MLIALLCVTDCTIRYTVPVAVLAQLQRSLGRGRQPVQSHHQHLLLHDWQRHRLLHLLRLSQREEKARHGMLVTNSYIQHMLLHLTHLRYFSASLI